MAGGTIPGATRTLAEFVGAARSADLGDGAWLEVRMHAMDGLGVGLAAVPEEPAREIADVLATFGRGGDVRMIGTGLELSPWDAAWANGSLIHLLDFDDSGPSHPTACLLPTALAVGELVDASLEDFGIALAVGWEVYERVARSGRANEHLIREVGRHTTAIYGCPAAAATASRLLGLDAAQTEIAIGLACSSAAGLTEQFGTWGKGLHAGNAARAGVQAALLAQRGYFGAAGVLEAGYGLMRSVLGDAVEWSGVLDDLRTSWVIEKPGITIKQYPACGGAQRGIQAAIELNRRLGGDVSAVDSIVVRVRESIFQSLHVDFPARGFEGKFSLRYAVAVALVDGDMGVESFSDESFARPSVQEAMHKIVFDRIPGGYEPGLARFHTNVRVTLANGEALDEQVDTPLGSIHNRMTLQQVGDKYSRQAERVLPAETVASSRELFDSFATGTVRELMDLVAPRQGRAA